MKIFTEKQIAEKACDLRLKKWLLLSDVAYLEHLIKTLEVTETDVVKEMIRELIAKTTMKMRERIEGI